MNKELKQFTTQCFPYKSRYYRKIVNKFDARVRSALRLSNNDATERRIIENAAQYLLKGKLLGYVNIEENQEAEYIVDETNGIVVCNLTSIPETQEVWCTKTMRFRGVARCAPEDTFDLETGKRIALKKARAKLNKTYYKRVRTVYSIAAAMTEELQVILQDAYSEVKRYE